MELRFQIEGMAATFVRDAWTGRAELRVGTEVRELQSPGQMSTHLSISTRTVWSEVVGEHAVEIEKVRPRLFGGLRPNSFVVRVDGRIAAQASGK